MKSDNLDGTMAGNSLRIAFAGDRDVSVRVLRFLSRNQADIQILMVPSDNKASHANQLLSLCPNLDKSRIIVGKKFQQDKAITMLRKLSLDYIICVHFPYIVPAEILTIPRYGVLNLHPAYLPYNRGWHTPSWAINDNTPYGATLHMMAKKLDSGNIIHQKKIAIAPEDTAHSLYSKVKKLEYEVFKEAWPEVAAHSYKCIAQQEETATQHHKKDLKRIQKIDLNSMQKTNDLINRMRALTTSDVNESAYFIENGVKYHLQIKITPEKETGIF